MKTQIKTLTKQAFYAFAGIATLLAYFPVVVSAAQITDRSVEIGSSLASASTTYQFTFTVPTSTAIKSVQLAACQEASGGCTAVTGFSGASANLTGQPTNIGASDWVDESTATALKIKSATNTTSPSAGIVINFDTVTNPSSNGTYFFQITTYSDDAYTTAIDTGTVATSTAAEVTVTAAVDETLTFTVTNTSVDLGTLTSSTTGSGTSNLLAGTNASSGYAITYTGTTLTSGSDTITAMAAATTSSQGSEQFGLNLKDNATPNVGAEASGGTGAAATGYATADNFKFASGDTVASASGASADTTYTVSYIANVASSTEAGTYTTTIDYVATAQF